MRLSEVFGWKSSHTHTYTDNPNNEWLELERSRLEMLAIENDIPMAIRLREDGDGFDFKFPEFFEASRFQTLAFGDGYNPSGHGHTEAFNGGDPVYQQQWTEYAQKSMNELGIRCDIETDGNEVSFKFDTVSDHAIFVQLRDIGMFDDMVHHPEEFEFTRPIGFSNPSLN